MAGAVEYRVIGPPGTGKTQYVRRQVELWAFERELYAPADFVLCSYTKAAAAVLRGRVPVPDDHVATLHSLGWRALGRPPIAEVPPLVNEWNAAAPSSWRIGQPDADLEEGYLPDDRRESAFDDYNLWRALGSPRPHILEEKTRDFAQAWEAFKREKGAVDFGDMIDLPRLEGLPCPGAPRVIIMDEAQDAVPAQWALVRYWASACDHFIVAGDPAQTIYAWAGARPDELLQPLPERRQKLLARSYRLPAAVHRYAERWLQRHSGPLAQGRDYQPRETEGLVRRLDATYRSCDPLLDDIERVLQETTRTMMVLATCSYMLSPVLEGLRDRGIPYHNPYRRAAGAWNPLRPARDGQVSTIERLLAYLRPDRETWGRDARWWTAQDARLWLTMVRADQFQLRGGRDRLLEALRDEEAPDQVLQALQPEAALAAATLDVDWLSGASLERYRKLLAFGARIRRRWTGKALRETPRVIVGTIHSVKGGEADVVYVLPDISYQAWVASFTREGRDALVRVFYVAFTRAREELVLLEPSNGRLSAW
jgi:DNA helicase II / ATP-dependent DNA helicase PcrA